MKLKSFVKLLAGVAIAAAFIGKSPADADVLYSSGPANPDSYNLGADAIGSFLGDTVTNKFILSSSSTITEISFASWTSVGLIASVDWAITTSAFGGTIEASGTATSFTATTLGQPSGFDGKYTVSIDTFSIASLNLTAGTYWLQLSNASSDELGLAEVFWDKASLDPSGSAFQRCSNPDPDICPVSDVGSHTFQILGSSTAAVPGPIVGAGLPGLLAGFGAMLAWHRKRRAAI